MKIFIDSNIILEYVLQRERVDIAESLILTLLKDHHSLIISAGGFYPMIYIVDNHLKKVVGLKGTERIEALRIIMEEILQIVDVASHDKTALLRGIHDLHFKDLEDSCQYQLAVAQGCDYLITFNTSDYPEPEDGTSLKVVSPDTFLSI